MSFPVPGSRFAVLARSSTPPWLCSTLAVVGLAVLLQPPARAAGRLVSFRAGDGRTLTGLYFEAAQRPAPAVVLVPMVGRSRDEWQHVAQRLAEAGIAALAIDLPSSSLPPDAAGLAGWHTDIRAAIDHLSARPDVRGGAFGVAGASLGANLAVLAAAADPRIRSLALVSPSLDYRGVRIEAPMRRYTGAVLLIASLRDPYAARTVRELTTGTSPGIREPRWAETTAHGTILLAQEPDLVRALADWFRRTLG